VAVRLVWEINIKKAFVKLYAEAPASRQCYFILKHELREIAEARVSGNSRSKSFGK